MMKKLGVDKTLITYVTLNILMLTGEMLMDIGVQLLIIKASSFYKAYEEKTMDVESLEIKDVRHEANITKKARFDAMNIEYLNLPISIKNKYEMPNTTKEDVDETITVKQSEQAASYLLYNRIILEACAFILLPFYSIVLAKHGPKPPIVVDCVFLIGGGVGYIMCIINIHKNVLDYVLLSTFIRSFSAMHGVFYIAASTAISYGYSGKDLSERHHWLFSARFIGSILAYYGQGTLEMFVGIKYVILMSISLFTLAIIIVLMFLSNANEQVKEGKHDDIKMANTNGAKRDTKSITGDDKISDLTINGGIHSKATEDNAPGCGKYPDERSHLINSHDKHPIDRIKQSITTFFSSLSETFKEPAPNMSRNLYIISILTILLVQLFDRMIKMARKDTVFLYLMMSSWDEAQVSFLLATEAICSFLILTFGVTFITRVLQFGDYTTCSIVLFLRTISFTWYSLRTSILEVCISTLLFMSPICLVLSALRSALSKLVPHENLIKIFSIMQLMDAAANILGTTLSLEFYKLTLDRSPGALFQVTAVLSFLMACAIGAVGFAQSKTQSNEIPE